MFKEQLHKSFDSISPSPELLDRISEMMSEEVNKKKPPLRLQAAKYGGIAAALLLAAGGAYAAIRASDDVHTGSAPVNAGEAMYYAAGDAEEAPDGGQMIGARLYEQEAVDETAPAAALTTTAAAALTTTAPAAAFQENADEAASEAGDIAAAGGIAPPSDGEAPSGNDNGRSDFVEPESFTAENPGTGGEPYTFVFEFPFTDSFRNIPDSLLTIPDGVKTYTEDGYVMGERWREYFAASNPGYDPDADDDAAPVEAGTIDTGYPDITSIDECDNAYTFIRYFGISDDAARAALAGYYTDEQINILLSGDKAQITAAFASDYAIVKGERAYSPLWLYRRSYDEWREAGITQADILQKYDALTHLPETIVSQQRQDAVIQKITGFIE